MSNISMICFLNKEQKTTREAAKVR